MNKFLFALIGFAALIFLITNDTWRVTLDTSDYQVSVSFVLFLVGLFLLWYFLNLLTKPLHWWGQFQDWRKNKKQQHKNLFLSTLLTALLSHQTEKKDEIISEAKSLYGAKSQEVLLISALFQPQQEIFLELNKTDETKLAGLYGLIQEAEKEGNFQEISSLLEQVPSSLEHTPWIQQTKIRLALNQSDWTTALQLLEKNKKSFSKEIFLSHKACLLFKLGQIKKAYHLMPSNCPIALAYAKINPKKAPRILEKTWRLNPCWPIYQAYKETIAPLPDAKRLKAVLALTRKTRDERYSLLARADIDMSLQNWARAKENLEIYLQKYPLTRQVATMMASVERTGWHHEQTATEWEQKAIESEDDSLWLCSECNHTSGTWQVLCPHCNAFDTLYIK